MRIYLTVAAIGLMLSVPFDVVHQGRLTDAACWFLLGVLIVAWIDLYRLDRGVAAGRIDPATLPRFMQEPSERA